MSLLAKEAPGTVSVLTAVGDPGNGIYEDGVATFDFFHSYEVAEGTAVTLNVTSSPLHTISGTEALEDRTMTGSGSTFTTTDVEYVHDSFADIMVSSTVDPSIREPADAVYIAPVAVTAPALMDQL